MNLLLGALIAAIHEVARSKDIRHYRVAYKRNARGELVIALIINDPDGPLSAEKLEAGLTIG